jgi:hypothetical protein
MNSYDKLRPCTDIESCKCDSVTSLLLIDLLTDNPLHCAACRREVDPERIALSTEDTEEIARWFSTAKSLYWLWLDSGEYEAYAKARLLDTQGQINVRGRPVCGKPLNQDVRWGTGQCVGCCIRI